MITAKTWFLRFVICIIINALCTAQADVTLHVGDNFQDSVNAYPEATAFIIESGLHRLQSVTPKSGDTFTGQENAIMNGAQILDAWTPSGQFWATDYTIPGFLGAYDVGFCDDGRNACVPQWDIYFDSKFLTKVLTAQEMAANSWYYDRDNGRIFVSEDPTGHEVELSLSPYAFSGNVENVTVQNLIIEKYAVESQECAIGGASCVGWTVMANEVRLCHAGGIFITESGIASNNYVHHNAQNGLKVVYGSNALVENNEISFNTLPEIGYRHGWENGGTKFVRTTNLIVRGNNVHHNDGPGLWADGSNINLLYENNIVEDNTDNGIFHEISRDAVIRCNTVRRNGLAYDDWLWGAQIIISTSYNVEIYGNLVEIADTSGHGITIVSQRRGSSSSSHDNYIHHNIIIYNALRGLCGAAADYDIDNFWASGNNRFDYNTYYAPGNTSRLWHWSDGLANWEAFTLTGQEQNGIFIDNNTSAPAAVPCIDDSVSIRTSHRNRLAGANMRKASAHQPADSRMYDFKGRRIASAFSATSATRSQYSSGVFLFRSSHDGRIRLEARINQ